MDTNTGAGTSQPRENLSAAAVGDERRRAATAAHTAAIAAINAAFDRVGELNAARDMVAGVASRMSDDDPIRAAETLLQAAHRVQVALEDVRRAAQLAAEHRSRQDLARDIGTRRSALFPRAAETNRSKRARRSDRSPSDRPVQQQLEEA